MLLYRCLLLEGSRSDAPTSVTGRNLYKASAWVRHAADIASRNVLSISRDARVAAIEERRSSRVISPQGPVVVGEIALVPAFVAQSLFPRPHEVAVPRQKVALINISHSEETLESKIERTFPCVYCVSKM